MHLDAVIDAGTRAVAPAAGEAVPPLLLHGRAREGDAARIAALTRRAAPETVAVPEREVRARIGEFEVIRDAAGAVVGAAAVRPLDGARAELRSLAVDDAWRGRGLGVRLLRRAMERAGDSGRRLYCVTLRPRFFERHGFRRVALDALPRKPQRGARVAGRERVALAAPAHAGRGIERARSA